MGKKYVIDFKKLEMFRNNLCPCEVESGDIEKDVKNICPCDKFIDTGGCQCNVFREVDDEN